jgi:predicted enzyme related to lactoylglutathione lyase
MSNKQHNESQPFNAINWFEIPTANMDRAVAFYEATVKRTLKREVFAGLPHAVFPARGPNGSERAVAGAIVAGGPHLRPGASGTVVYLDCPDGVAAALGRATAHGATVVLPHTAIGPNGFIAIIDDPEGNRVGLHAMTS